MKIKTSGRLRSKAGLAGSILPLAMSLAQPDLRQAQGMVIQTE
jgi:hypothetical protein